MTACVLILDSLTWISHLRIQTTQAIILQLAITVLLQSEQEHSCRCTNLQDAENVIIGTGTTNWLFKPAASMVGFGPQTMESVLQMLCSLCLTICCSNVPFYFGIELFNVHNTLYIKMYIIVHLSTKTLEYFPVLLVILLDS
jgi:hypothetical protein